MASGTNDNSGNHVIKPGLRADIMRNLMETKNTLSTAGSIYVGTGTYTSMGPSGDLIEVYKTKALPLGVAGQILCANSDATDLEYRYISAMNFGGSGDESVRGFLRTYTALVDAKTEVEGHPDSRLIKLNVGSDDLKKVYVEHANTADSADQALSANTANTATTANTASVAAQVQMDTNGTITNVKFYTKTYLTLNDFRNDDQIKAAAAYGTITQALLGVKSGNDIIEYIPVMVIPGVPADANSKNSARIFDASSETAQWRTLTLADFSGGNVLKVVYVR